MGTHRSPQRPFWKNALILVLLCSCPVAVVAWAGTKPTKMCHSDFPLTTTTTMQGNNGFSLFTRRGPNRNFPSIVAASHREMLRVQRQTCGSCHRLPATCSKRTSTWPVASLALAVLIFGTSLFAPCPAHAAATTTTTPYVASSSSVIERILEKTSPNVDQIIDKYVQTYMFNDERDDPLESSYREAYYDALTGRYPAQIQAITKEVLSGQSDVIALKGQPSSSTTSSLLNFKRLFEFDIGSALLKAVSLLQNRLKLSETAAIVVLAGILVVAGPTLFLLAGMVVGGISKRNMDKVFKRRYGDTYTVDATIKKEPIVEAPPDEDEDEDDDDEEEEDEDSDSDDDDDEKK